jgi:hypothetical protein
VVEVDEEVGQAVLRDRVDHVPFDGVDGGGGPGDQVRFLEAAQDGPFGRMFTFAGPEG